MSSKFVVIAEFKLYFKLTTERFVYIFTGGAAPCVTSSYVLKILRVCSVFELASVRIPPFDYYLG